MTPFALLAVSKLRFPSSRTVANRSTAVSASRTLPLPILTRRALLDGKKQPEKRKSRS
jgi:hypothetical protein